MKRVLFLDIDGVINPIPQKKFPRFDPHLQSRLAKEKGSDEFYHISFTALRLAYDCWDPVALRLLKELCDKYQLKIVISSSWGLFYSLKELQLLFSLYDLASYIIDTVPYVGKRSENIKHYLMEHPAIDVWISLDDLPMDSIFPRHAITTRSVFQEKDAKKAEMFLEKQL